MEKYEFIISEEQEGQRIDSVLSSLLEECSRSYIQKLIEGGYVSVKKKNEKLKAGQTVSITIPDAKPIDAQPEEMPLDIYYEDEDLIVVNKPKGLVVHPGAGHESGTLVNGLLYHCKALSCINGNERPGIVHRIDKDTSGLLVCAKSDLAQQKLSEQFAVHSITRKYLGICFFGFNEDKGTIDAPIGRDPSNRLRMAIVPNGKRAVTHYEVLERYNGFTLIEARLETGRTHQIRVHMASKNRPLLGDSLYGPAKQPYHIEGQMLHAKVLGFMHPRSGEYLEFTAPEPAEFTEVLDKLRKL